jgi:kynurenine formamidase
LIGSDTPAWQKDENVFDLFAATDTLLLAPLINLSEIVGKDCRLTVLPVSIENTCCAPARAVIIENE